MRVAAAVILRMIRPILKYGDPVLTKKSVPVDLKDPTLKRLVADMVDTMKAASGVGLAAVQVGVLKQVAVIDVGAAEKEGRGKGLIVLCNPAMVEKEGEVEEEEGCLSIPDLRGPAVRSSWCRVQATDLQGKPVEVSGDGLLGKALQHELDHLRGTLFVERMRLASRAVLSGRLKALKKETQEALKAGRK